MELVADACCVASVAGLGFVAFVLRVFNIID
jgi:hypothetical protein